MDDDFVVGNTVPKYPDRRHWRGKILASETPSISPLRVAMQCCLPEHFVSRRQHGSPETEGECRHNAARCGLSSDTLKILECPCQLEALVFQDQKAFIGKSAFAQRGRLNSMDTVPQCHFQHLQWSVQGLRKLRVEGMELKRPFTISLRPIEASCKTLWRKG